VEVFLIKAVRGHCDPRRFALFEGAGCLRHSGRGERVEANYAFVGYDKSGLNSQSDALEVLDLTNPTQPMRVGSSVSGRVTDVKVSGDYAYVAGGQGLTVLDIRDPANPTPVAEVGVNGRIVIQGNLLLSKSGNTLLLTDVSDPAEPTLQGGSDEAVLDTGITALVGNHALIAHTDRLRILDVSDPASPRSVGRYRSTGFLMDMVVVGNHAYLAVDGGWSTGGLEVLDISEPASPQRISYTDIGGPAQHLAVSGSRAYLSGSWFSSSPPTGPMRNSLHVIDISDPADPQRVGWSYTGTSGSRCSVAISNDRAYVAGGSDGLRLIDVSDPTLPRQLGRVSGINMALFVTVNEQRAYVLSSDPDGWATVEILDVSAPSNPVWVGRIDRALGDDFDYIFADGRYAYLTGLNNGSHIRVVDVSNPANPLKIAEYTRDYSEFLPRSVIRSGDHLYVADMPWFLQILRLDDFPVSVRLTVSIADGSLRVRWPSNAAAGLLEQSPDAFTTTWDPVPGTPQLNGDGYELSLPLNGPARFFRLRKP
jgi:hypothetical protein